MTTKQTTKLGDPIDARDWVNGPTYGPAPDPIRAQAEKNNPPSAAEVEAEALLERETARFNTWLRSAGRRMRDAGSNTGDTTGFGFLPDFLKNEYEDLRADLEKVLVR